MKRNLLTILLGLFVLSFTSCEEDDVNPIIKTKNETLTMGAGYANDIYYSLSNGVIAEVSRTNWDIAFSVDAMSSSILINDGAGVVLKEHVTGTNWNWSDAVDTTGYYGLSKLFNSDENWEEAAFSQNATGHPNYGWGEYNMTSHDVEGITMYIIKLVSGDYKRIIIEAKSAMGQEYTFKYSDIDGTNEVSETISFAGVNSNYIYYSIVNESVVDNREPDASTWDLLFTNYVDNTIDYIVTGVKQNIDVLVIEEDGVLDLSKETYLDTDFDESITEIGYDWKDFNMGTFQYELDADRIYFVKDAKENVYKIVFTGYEGSSTGNMTFDITSL
ncbi:HmuY family protein [Bacteroidota bacterium]